MKARRTTTSGLHLVSAAATPPPSDPGIDQEIAEGVKAFQAVQQQFDKELFSGSPDPEELGRLLFQRDLLRDRLAAHGIRVRA